MVAMTDAWLNAIVLIDVVSGAVVGTVPLMGVNGMLVVGEYALVGSAVGFYRVALLGAEERAEMWMTRESTSTHSIKNIRWCLRSGETVSGFRRSRVLWRATDRASLVPSRSFPIGDWKRTVVTSRRRDANRFCGWGQARFWRFYEPD